MYTLLKTSLKTKNSQLSFTSLYVLRHSNPRLRIASRGFFNIDSPFAKIPRPPTSTSPPFSWYPGNNNNPNVDPIQGYTVSGRIFRCILRLLGAFWCSKRIDRVKEGRGRSLEGLGAVQRVHFARKWGKSAYEGRNFLVNVSWIRPKVG